MSMVSMLTWDRLEVDSTPDERQVAVMQERRYLAAALLGAGGGGGRWSERVKSAVQNRMKERARCEREWQEWM